MATLAADPPAAVVPDSGGTSVHQLVNPGTSRLAFKIKITNRTRYRIKPVFGFVEPGASTPLEITRLDGPPNEDKMVVQFAEVAADAIDSRAPFKDGQIDGEIVIPISAKNLSAENLVSEDDSENGSNDNSDEESDDDSQDDDNNNQCNTRPNTIGAIKRSQYEISSKELGHGAFSKVFVARHKQSKTIIAMKMVKLDELGDKYATLSKNEVYLLRKINSPYVIHLCDAFVVQNILHLALELIDDEDLSVRIQRMRDRGTIYSERSIWYKFYQICQGIKALHDEKILHRDLKPANIFITSKYRVKVGDLGLSRLCSSGENVKTVVGTPYYMAPERTNSNGYTFSSDIWSLGCVLYEICNFRNPFNGETTNAYSLHKKINNEDIIPFAMNLYSEELRYFINACLNLKPDDRPTADECADVSRAMYEKFELMLVDYKESIATKKP